MLSSALRSIGGAMEARSQQHGVIKVVIFGGLVFALAMTGVYVIVDRMPAADRHLTGTIVARHGSTCQRLVVDNGTGAIKSVQQIPCGDPPREVPTSIGAPSARYSSGGRVDIVRDSFRNR